MMTGSGPDTSAIAASEPMSRAKRHGAAALLACVALPAHGEWHGAVSFATDYFYRGYSKSRGNPVAQASLSYAHDSGGYAGLDFSQVGFDDQCEADHAQVEFKPYLGWALPLSPEWRAELAASGYVYDGHVFGQDSNYSEVYASLHFRDLLTARFAWAPDAYQRGADILDYEIQGRYDLMDNLRFSAGLGYYQSGSLLEYNSFYWNAGLTWYPHLNISADLRYVDSDAHAYPQGHPGQFNPRSVVGEALFTISVGF